MHACLVISEKQSTKYNYNPPKSFPWFDQSFQAKKSLFTWIKNSFWKFDLTENCFWKFDFDQKMLLYISLWQKIAFYHFGRQLLLEICVWQKIALAVFFHFSPVLLLFSCWSFLHWRTNWSFLGRSWMKWSLWRGCNNDTIIIWKKKSRSLGHKIYTEILLGAAGG